MPQDQEDAKLNVSKRLEFINTEMYELLNCASHSYAP